MSKKVFLKGTLILACTGLVSRIAGFFYRIFLSHAIGAEGLGLYQLILPLQGLMAALSYTGIQSALSRLIASRLALQEKKEAYFSLVTGIFAAVFFSAVTGFLLFRHADFFASTILKAPGTSDFLRLTAASIPLCAIHSCIDSYYYARKKASVPAAVQLSEQAVRIGATYILYLIFLSENRPVTALIAACGSLAGEAAASLISLLMVSFHFGNHPVKEKTSVKIFPLIKDLFTLSFPISLNRILLTLLGSIEAVLIPQMLIRCGMTSSEALKIYGIFTGMALPLLLFPSTITTSAAVMLMPSVARMDALGDQKQIRYVTDQTFFLCMFLGFLCGSGFFLFGPFLGTLLFHSKTAGTYIRYLSYICPFLYTNTMLASILQGLGRPGRCLIHSAAGILIRIFSVVFMIPAIGIRGYFYGIFLGELLLSLLHVKALKFPYRQAGDNRL